MFKCSRCGHEYAYPWSNRCPACGAELKHMLDEDDLK